MTSIQQFLEKAFVGGWQPADRDFRIIGFYERYFEYELRSIAPGQRSVPRMMAYEAVLLKPEVWQAVGKMEKWYEGHDGPEWPSICIHDRRFAEGKTLEAYIQSVLAKSGTKEV